MRGSDYAELRAFAMVAELGSFARAAARLNVSPSALSQTIRSLEDRLGVRLINRTTRSVAPSEAGTRLIGRLRPLIDDLEAAVAEVRALSEKPSGLLRINAARFAAIHYLAPLLGPFHHAYPDIVLDLAVEDRLVDIVIERFDAGIRLGETVEKDMIAVKLNGDLEMMVVAAPAYLRRFGSPRTPRDLLGHQCVNTRWPSDGRFYHSEFERGDEKLEVAVTGPLIATEMEVVTRAVIDGVGIGYLFADYVNRHLAEGTMVRLLDDWTPPFPGLYLYHPSRRQMPPPLRAFIDFLRQPHPAKQVVPKPR